MQEDYAKELLRSGIIEAKAGSKESARRYLDRAIYMSGSHDVLAEAWFWMGEITDDPVEKRKALENCLSHDMRHSRARRALAILDGKLKADEVINPDKLPAAPNGSRKADADRFMCPKCGGRMSFAPDGQTLVCEYCTRRSNAWRQDHRKPRKRISSSPWQPPADMASRCRNRSFIAKAVARNSFCRQNKFHPPVPIAPRRMWSASKRQKTCSRPMESSRMCSTKSAPSNC